MIQDGILVIDPIYNLIKILNENGHQVIKIDDEFFIFTSFIPADRTTPYHTIHGKHITKLLVDYYRTGMQNFLAVEQAIGAEDERDIQYHADFKWIQYLK